MLLEIILKRSELKDFDYLDLSTNETRPKKKMFFQLLQDVSPQSNDQVSSFIVPRGVNVTLFQDYLGLK